MTLLVRDEADIVAANLDYHFAQGVDFVIATDHSSRDGTAEVLRQYERDGMLSLREAGGEAHDQVTHVNAMARTAATEHGADWVINNDADEFWWPALGSLKDVLSAVPDEVGALVASRSNFLPRPDGPGPLLERMVVREAASRNGRGQPLEPKVIHRATAEIEMAPGNHSIVAPDLTLAPDLGLLEVLHLPMRTFEQFERKVLNVGVGYERLEPRGADVGRDQLALLEMQRQGRLRALFDDLVVDGGDLDAAVAGGRVVVDTRLRDFLAGSGSAEELSRSSATGRLVSNALRLAGELDVARRQLDAERATARAELERRAAELENRAAQLAAVSSELTTAQTELARLDEAVRAAHAEREHAEQRLASTDAELRALQTSRLIRYSEPLRKLVYRLRGQA